MYKTILVHVDGSAPSAGRIDIASALALRHGAHLVGLALTGLAPCAFPVVGFDPGMPAVTFPVEQLRLDAERALDTFEAAVRAAGVESVERRCVDDEAGVGISMQARYADLVIVGTLASGDLFPPPRTGYPASLLLNCPRPVLVIPPSGVRALPCHRVAIGWNGSAGALRAISSAIPVLRTAREVKVVVLNADREPDLHGAEPGADIGLYLARHGVAVDVLATESGLDPGAALLEYAAASGTDLIVMGAYGHSRFRDILLGGGDQDRSGSVAATALDGPLKRRWYRVQAWRRRLAEGETLVHRKTGFASALAARAPWPGTAAPQGRKAGPIDT